MERKQTHLDEEDLHEVPDQGHGREDLCLSRQLLRGGPSLLSPQTQHTLVEGGAEVAAVEEEVRALQSPALSLRLTESHEIT